MGPIGARRPDTNLCPRRYVIHHPVGAVRELVRRAQPVPAVVQLASGIDYVGSTVAVTFRVVICRAGTHRDRKGVPILRV